MSWGEMTAPGDGVEDERPVVGSDLGERVDGDRADEVLIRGDWPTRETPGIAPPSASEGARGLTRQLRGETLLGVDVVGEKMNWRRPERADVLKACLQRGDRS